MFRLACEWSFHDIRDLAIKRLEPIATPIDKIALGHAFGFFGWLRDAYMSLCMRPSPLSVAEIKTIRAEDVALIIEVRERALLRERAIDEEVESSVSSLVDSLSGSQHG